MSNKTRKRIWPVSLVAVLGVLAMLAMMAVATAGTPAPTLAQGDPANPFGGTPSTPTPTDDGNGDPSNPFGRDRAPGVDKIESSSTSASARVELKLTIASLPEDLPGGSSVVLYLEDEFNVDDEDDGIERGTVYFTASGGSAEDDESTSNGRRIYATDPVEIDTDGYFTHDKDDWHIQVLIPDMNTSDVDKYSNFDGPKAGQTLTLTFTKSAGIRNDSEEGTHSVGYSILGPTDAVGNPEKKDADIEGAPLATVAKIGLSDPDNDRGYELVVTGSGFNNGTSAAVHVLGDATPHPEWWNSVDCDERKAISDTTDNSYCKAWSSLSKAQQDTLSAIKLVDAGGAAEATFCRHVITSGQRAGIGTVGSDDTVAVTVEVTVPIFVPGNNNYICMVDGEGRSSSTDVEDFNLLDSLRVVPASAAAGDTVNVFAQDFPVTGAGLTSLKIAGQEVFDVPTTDRNRVSVTADTIGHDGSATATFDLPGSISGSALEGTVRIDATWGETSEDGKITVTGSQLNLSKGEALPNETITITGDGFGGDYINVANITIDGVALLVDSDSTHREGGMEVVDVSNAGQFVASIVLWPEGDSGSNPSLIAGTHTIEVEDNSGFSGSAVVVIPEPSIKVTPEVAGPRDTITITGENWPIDNVDGGNPDAVDIEISDGTRARKYSAFADSAGRFTIEHRVASNVAIPSTNQVRAKMGADIVKVGSFEVPAAIIEIDPAEGQPGDHITLSVDGMPVYQQVDRVEIGGRSVMPVGNFSTDNAGSVTVENVLIPGLDPGTYSVLLDVDETIAIGELNVLAEARGVGPAAQLPDAVDNLGDSLVAVFYFDDVGKTWSFYDPREEFADLNTLSEMVSGEAYWILVSDTVEDAVLNNTPRSLSCRGDDCWNLEVW